MMRPEEILSRMLRWWWIVVIAALAAGLVAYIGTSAQPKEYTVSVRVMAVAEPPDYWMDLYAKNRLASYRDLIDNWSFINQALQEAGHEDIDPGLAQSKLQLGHNPDANTVQIVVVDTDPERAADIANALADAFIARNEKQNEQLIDQIADVEERVAGRVNMLALEEANPPTTPSGPRVRVNALAGTILGALAGITLAFYLVYRDDRIVDAEDLERYAGGPLLATIPRNAHERTG